ncbi:unnamed protein product [Orchesella dallaii]|uniref:[histone H3]-lysine(4) N-trimethyltransferase n=1 Tax=Orchesella dallaii TaxID=48710 RepID=A0ABP1RPJ0_9HEXA
MGETDKPPESNGGDEPQAPSIPSSSIAQAQTEVAKAPPPRKKREYTAYKLIVDPALVKGALKVYRFDGVIPGDPSSYPSIILRDPRKQKILRKPTTDSLRLPVPQFRVDSNCVGEIPPREVTFTNLNDNVSEIYLRNISEKFGFVKDVKIYHHPISHRHLGIGHVIFKTSRDAKLCVDKLNASYLLGQKVNVCRDPNGKKCTELFIEVTTQKPGAASKDDIKNGKSGTATPSGTKSLALHPKKSSSKQNHLNESRYYKDDRKSTHHNGVSSDDRKSFFPSSISPSSKIGSWNRDKDSGDVFKRFNINYERYEPSSISTPGSTNYGYPIPGGSSLTSSLSTTQSSLSSFQHQQVSLPSSPLVGTNVGGWNSSNCGEILVNNPNTDKGSDDEELSPKIDLETRIKMLLAGKNSGELGKLFADGNISATSESDGEASPLKKAKLSLGTASAPIWDSESEDESKEASFSRKFKQSFVPVGNDDATSSRGRALENNSPMLSQTEVLSPPPSPFLTFSSNSASKSVKGKADPDPELDQISEDEDSHLDKDDMSLSSLSPDADSSSRIKQHQFGLSHPPLPPNSVHSSYYGEYYNKPYPQNYQMPPWSGGQGHGSLPELEGNYQNYAHVTNYGDNNSYQQDYYPQQTEPIQPEVKEEKKEDDKNQDPTFLINALIEYMVDDLTKVLRRDCHRRLIETEAFKLFEDWWDKEESELKRKQDEENAKSLSTLVEPVVVAPIPETDNIGMGLGISLGFRNIPKLPSFRKKRKIELPTPVTDEDSRKSYMDSDDDDDDTTDSSSDEEEEKERRQRRLKTKQVIAFFSSDEESEASTLTTKSSLSEGQEVEVSDAEAISTTEDADEFSDSESKSFIKTENKGLPTPKVEMEGILSDDDSQEEPGAVSDKEERSLRLCDRTGRMIMVTKSPMEESIQVPVDATLPPPPTVSAKQEMNDEGVLEDLKQMSIESDRALALSLDAKLNGRKSRYDAGYMNTPEYNEEKPIIIPYEAVRPRGDNKSRRLGFRPRIDDEMLNVLYEFLKEGIDAEDIQYFKEAYDRLRCDDPFIWFNSTLWVHHPETVIKKKPPTSLVKKKTVPGSEDGSLRARGFVRMTKEEKMLVLDGQQLSVTLALGGDKGKSRETKIREARSAQRRLLTALGTESDLLKFNQLQFRKKALRFARSGIHEWGLFAAEPIAPDDMVIEYVGQMIRPVVADLRETKYEARGIGSSYLFRIDQEAIIDATTCGSLSRFINHSCNPNCYAKVITIGGEKKIVIYSKQPIAVSEEITYDYKFPLEDKKIPCLCGTAGCRGTLN